MISTCHCGGRGVKYFVAYQSVCHHGSRRKDTTTTGGATEVSGRHLVRSDPRFFLFLKRMEIEEPMA